MNTQYINSQIILANCSTNEDDMCEILENQLIIPLFIDEEEQFNKWNYQVSSYLNSEVIGTLNHEINGLHDIFTNISSYLQKDVLLMGISKDIRTYTFFCRRDIYNNYRSDYIQNIINEKNIREHEKKILKEIERKRQEQCKQEKDDRSFFRDFYANRGEL